MSFRSFKRFIAIFAISILLSSFVLPQFFNRENFAATVGKPAATTKAVVPVLPSQTQETTKKKTVGHKIEGAEYYDEMWEKFRVIAVDNGGGNGAGGGAGDNQDLNAGNGGDYNDAGGIGGDATGKGLGFSKNPGLAGTGGGANGSGSGAGDAAATNNNGNNGNQGYSKSSSGGPGSSGSALADALRALKQDIQESRAESLANALESAVNASMVAASIAERESIQASIQKKLLQESIKAKVAPKETQETVKTFETPAYIPQAAGKSKVDQQVYSQTLAPTSEPTQTQVQSVGRVINIDELRQTTEHKVDAVNMLKGMVAKTETQNVEAPTTKYQESSIAPEEVTEALPEVFFDAPVVPALPEAVQETTGETEKAKANEEKEGESGESSDQKQSTVAESADDESEGKGSKGGENTDADEDKQGDDGKNESMGNADEKGKFHLNKEHKNEGKKIFEIEAVGNIGLDDTHLSVVSTKAVIIVSTILLFILGVIAFLISNIDKKNKKNYF